MSMSRSFIPHTHTHELLDSVPNILMISAQYQQFRRLAKLWQRTNSTDSKRQLHCCHLASKVENIDYTPDTLQWATAKTAPLPVESGEYKLIVPWPRVNISNSSSTGSVAFVGLTFVTNGHTDRHTDRHTHTDHTGRQTHRLHLRPKNSNQRRRKIMTSKCPTKRGKSKGSPYSLTRFLAVSLQVM